MSRPASNPDSGSTPEARGWFTTTHWSVVLAAGLSASPQATDALEKLCRTYWLPLYSFVRRHGHSPHDAQDLTQAFFAKLLEKNFWSRADPHKGRFRSFLLTALRQFLADERDRAQTIKRGGGLTFLPLDEQLAETRYLEAPGDGVSPEKVFDRQWAAAVLEQARARLREECIVAGKGELYERLKFVESGEASAFTYAELAAQLGMTESAIKSVVSRLRQRFGELLREEVAHTVAAPADLDEEIRYLLAVIGS